MSRSGERHRLEIVSSIFQLWSMRSQPAIHDGRARRRAVVPIARHQYTLSEVNMGKLSGFGFREVSQAAIFRFGQPVVLAVIFGVLLFVGPCFAQNGASELPSETPAMLTPVQTNFDYVKRDVMIPMRDGVKLHTVIVLPNCWQLRLRYWFCHRLPQGRFQRSRKSCS